MCYAAPIKVLFLSRSDSGKPHAFVMEQGRALERNFSIQVDHFLVRTGGIKGSVSALLELKKYLSNNRIDVLHVHYGLWAMIAIATKMIFLKNYKIVITYHGSDIFKKSERKFSQLASRFAAHNIVVSERMLQYIHKQYSVIPCGIDTDVQLVTKAAARKLFDWNENDFIILFSSNFKRQVKDPEFAFKVIEAYKKQTRKSVQFIELVNYSREQLTTAMQAADALIMCSKSEGSPQIIKEAILNTLPIVSNDIGDVKSICNGVDNCFIVNKNIAEYIISLNEIADSNSRIKNRNLVIDRFDNNKISERLYEIYGKVLYN
ncbi:MAG: glycosyltransferase family 4 protein [Bacteroidota bacterium]